VIAGAQLHLEGPVRTIDSSSVRWGRRRSLRDGHTSVVTVVDRPGHLLPGSEDRMNDALDALDVIAPGTPGISIPRNAGHPPSLRHRGRSARRRRLLGLAAARAPDEAGGAACPIIG